MTMKNESLESFRNKKSVVLDTCFILHELLNQREKQLLDFCEENTVIITSFNLAELKKVSKKLGHDKKIIRSFLEKNSAYLVSIPVSPGERDKEKEYVNDFDPAILKKVRDASDAVLVVAAIKSGSNILTRDKHHLFTTSLSEELHNYGLNVFNDISTLKENT